MTPRRLFGVALMGSAICVSIAADARERAPLPDFERAGARARDTVRRIAPAEKTRLTHGSMLLPLFPDSPPVPPGGVAGAGFIEGIPRLGIPPLKESDATLGVAYVMGLRKDGATALPSGMAMASTWDAALLYDAGAMIGAEAHAKGFNVLLAGGANLIRDPRNGRTFEYLSEDPLLTGDLAGASIAGVQSNPVIATIKHLALNAQETGRKYVEARIGEAAARESDLLAFQIGIEKGRPGAVMCAYNRVRDGKACDSQWLLNDVLKRDWRYKGFVMSDWGATPGIGAALHGLDQQSGEQLDGAVHFGAPLAAAAARDPAYAARLDDMNARILTAIYALGLDSHPATPGGRIDVAANAAVAEAVARQGIVLLKNRGDILPLSRGARRIAVIGGFADSGVLSGGGSSQVQGEGGPAISLPITAEGPFAAFITQQYHRSSPLKAIRAMAPGAGVTYRDGRYIADAVEQARRSDVAIVFATQWMTEGFDVADLSLPGNQDQLIAAVAAANPNTIVVLETGGPVLMPWLDRVAGVMEAWYPGARGGEAIASVLFGETNPSGHLPVTFPASEADLPRPHLDGYRELEPDFAGEKPTPRSTLVADYTIEGSDIGYRWNARTGRRALFPFGHGLSYTSFAHGGLRIDGLRAQFTVRNTGARAGTDVAQLYLLSRGGTRKQRLVGYVRVSLAPGEVRAATVEIDPRLLADWRDGGGWTIPAGDYRFALGEDAETLGPPVTVRMAARTWTD